MFTKVMDKFNEYTSNYDMSIKEIALKYHHSLEVMNLMGELAFRLNLKKEKVELARVIGLLHDIGRFEQFMKIGEFNDTVLDHADQSAIYLFEEGHIREFIQDDKYDMIIEKAIKYHNKYEIPSDLTCDELLFVKMIRDMDKVDIYHQVAVNYDFIFKADEITREVLEVFKSEKTISRKITRSKSDKIIELLGFIFDINFDESYDILVETDNFDLFLSIIEVDNNSEKLWKKLREICFDKINRGCIKNE